MIKININLKIQIKPSHKLIKQFQQASQTKNPPARPSSYILVRDREWQLHPAHLVEHPVHDADVDNRADHRNQRVEDEQVARQQCVPVD